MHTPEDGKPPLNLGDLLFSLPSIGAYDEFVMAILKLLDSALYQIEGIAVNLQGKSVLVLILKKLLNPLDFAACVVEVISYDLEFHHGVVIRHALELPLDALHLRPQLLKGLSLGAYP